MLGKERRTAISQEHREQNIFSTTFKCARRSSRCVGANWETLDVLTRESHYLRLESQHQRDVNLLLLIFLQAQRLCEIRYYYKILSAWTKLHKRLILWFELSLLMKRRTSCSCKYLGIINNGTRAWKLMNADKTIETRNVIDSVNIALNISQP